MMNAPSEVDDIALSELHILRQLPKNLKLSI